MKFYLMNKNYFFSLSLFFLFTAHEAKSSLSLAERMIAIAGIVLGTLGNLQCEITIEVFFFLHF